MPVNISMVNFIESTFKVIGASGDMENVKLTAAQKAAINAIEFGYDIINVHHPPKVLPKGVLMNWPRGGGKTFSIACSIAAHLVLENNVRIGATATDEGLAKEIKEIVRSLLASNPNTDALVEKEDVLKIIVRKPGGGRNKFTCHPHSESIRGRHFHILFIDEAAKYDQEILESAVLPTVRRFGRRWIMLSTPRGRINDTIFGRRIVSGITTRPIICSTCGASYPQEKFDGFYFGAPRLPQNLDECYNYKFKDVPPPGLPPCEKCGKDIYEYGVGKYSVIFVDPLDYPNKTREEVIEEVREAGNTPLARQEIFGEFIEGVATVFREDWINAAILRGGEGFPFPRQDVFYVMGVDFGKYHDASVICVTHMEGEDVFLDYMTTKSGKDIAGQTLDYKDVRFDIISICRSFNVSVIVADATGVGDPIMEQLKTDLMNEGLGHVLVASNRRNRPGYVIGGAKAKADLVGVLEKLFTSNHIIFPRNEKEVAELKNELLSFAFEVTRSNVIYGTQTTHDDRIFALALSCWFHFKNKWVPSANSFGGKPEEIIVNPKIEGNYLTSVLLGDGDIP